MWRSIFFYLVCFFLVGCGGGGGKYYPPAITLNSNGIIKSAFVDDNKSEKLVKIFVEDVKVNTSDDFFENGEKYTRSKILTINNSVLKIAIPFGNWVSLITSEGEIVTKLGTPRYVTDAVAVELTDQGQGPFLAVLIRQQATSHSSTLYILDTFFRPIYKEHLLGAIWISKAKSSCGDQLFVCTEDKWKPGDQWINVGGKWRYSIFHCL